MKYLGNTLILGDSYSTFEGYIPKGYAVYYTGEVREDHAFVSSVEKTWWKMLMNETDSKLILNNSWSGSTVCYSHYCGICPEQSFVERAKKHLVNGYCDSQKIDTVLVFGGTNDSWVKAPLGEPKYADWTEKDFESFFPAFCFLLTYLKNSSDDIRIINITNTQIKAENKNGIIQICEKLGIENIVLEDIEIEAGHPTERGMEQIKNQVLEKI